MVPSKPAIEAVLITRPRSPSSLGSEPLIAAAARRVTLNAPDR